MSAIPWVGQDIVEFIWGGFSVNNATLNRFFALHFVLPFVLAALALMHLIALHDSAGSGNPLGVSGNYDRLPFAPYFIFKDLITIFIFIIVLSLFVFFMPNMLGDSENYVMANPMQTPPAIVPEWYLLPFYAILRSIPNKLLGVIAMFSAILILLVMPYTDLSEPRGIQFRPLSKIAFYMFIANFLILMQLGAKHVESPFIELGQICTVYYFAHFLIIVPLLTLLENSLVNLGYDTNFSEEKEAKYIATLSSNVLVIDLLANLNNLNNAFEGMTLNGNGNDLDLSSSVMGVVQAVPSLIDTVSITHSPTISQLLIRSVENIPIDAHSPNYVLDRLAPICRHLLGMFQRTPLITIPSLTESPTMPITQSILHDLIKDVGHLWDVNSKLLDTFSKRTSYFESRQWNAQLIANQFEETYESFADVQYAIENKKSMFEKYMTEHFEPNYPKTERWLTAWQHPRN